MRPSLDRARFLQAPKLKYGRSKVGREKWNHSRSSHPALSRLVRRVWFFFFFSSRRRHTRSDRDWSSDVCSSDLPAGVAAPPPSPAYTNAFELRVTLDQLGRDRQAIDRVLAQPSDSGLSADALVVIDAVQKSPELMQALKELTDKQAELRALRYTYTDQNFPVQQLADAVATLEHRTIPALLRAVRDNLAVRARDVEQRVDSTVRYLSNIPPLLFEQTRLEREVQVAGQLYASLQQHHDEARVAEASAVTDVRILDAPDQPYRPIGSLAPFVLIMSFLASAGLG